MNRCVSAATRSAFTIMEVLVAACLIALSIGSIMTINVKSFQTLRASREAAASSQVLQQRIEMVRDLSWSKVANSPGILALMQQATASEAELSDPDFVESLKVTVPQTSSTGPVETAQTFTVTRTKGRVQSCPLYDFGAQPTLFFEGMVTWHDASGVHQRNLRTIVCRIGLTRSGITGSVLGRPGTELSGP